MSGNDNPIIVLTIDDAMDRLGTGPFQHRILLASGSCFMADAMEVMLLTFLSRILQDEWSLTMAQTATIVALVFVGAMLGTLVLGPAGDTYGRLPIFFISTSIVGFFGLSTCFVQGYIALVITRFLVGFGLGGLTVPFDISAEFIPNKERGKYLILIQASWTLGTLLTLAAAFVSVGQGTSWRWFVALCASPCLLSLLLVKLFVPESPHWLLSQGRDQEAMDILIRGAIANGKDPSSIYPSGCILRNNTSPEVNHEARRESMSSFLALLKPRWRGLIFLLCSIWFLNAFGYWGTVISITLIFSSESDESNGKDGVSFDYSAIAISSTAEILGAFFGLVLIDRVGRVPTLVTAFIIGGTSLFLMLFSAGRVGRDILVFYSFCTRVCQMMSSSVVWIITPEILSTEIRTTGHAVANAVARIGGLLSPYVVTGLPLPHVGIIMLLTSCLSAVLACTLPETKGASMGTAVIQNRQEDMVQSEESVELV